MKGKRVEARTSRPLLLAAVGRGSQHAGQQRLLLTVMHAAQDRVKQMVATIRAGLDTIRGNAPQLAAPERWPALVHYIVDRIIAAMRVDLRPLTPLESG